MDFRRNWRKKRKAREGGGNSLNKNYSSGRQSVETSFIEWTPRVPSTSKFFGKKKNDFSDGGGRRGKEISEETDFSAVSRPIIARRERSGLDRVRISNASLIGGELFIFHDHREKAGPPWSGAIAIAADPGGSFSRALIAAEGKRRARGGGRAGRGGSI